MLSLAFFLARAHHRDTIPSARQGEHIMVRELIRRLGLDRIGEYIDEELRQAKLKALQEERTLVQSLLDRIEERLAAATGKPKPPKHATAKRPAKTPGKGAPRFRKPGESLKEMAVKALEAAKKPLAVDELRARVMKLGYRTAASADNLRVSFFKVLADTKLFKKVEAGVYKLARATKPEAAKPAAKKKSKNTRAAKRRAKKAAPKAAKKPAAPKQAKPTAEKKPTPPKPGVQPATQPAAETSTPTPTEKK